MSKIIDFEKKRLEKKNEEAPLITYYLCPHCESQEFHLNEFGVECADCHNAWDYGEFFGEE